MKTTQRKAVFDYIQVPFELDMGEDLFVDGFWQVDYFRQQSKAESRRGCCP